MYWNRQNDRRSTSVKLYNDEERVGFREDAFQVGLLEADFKWWVGVGDAVQRSA